MATQSSIVAWEIQWTEDPGRLQFMGSQKVGHDLATKQQQQQTSFRKVLYIYPEKFCLSLVIFIIKYLFNVILNNISLILFVNCYWNVKCMINVYLILFPTTLLNSLVISTNFLECVLECLYVFCNVYMFIYLECLYNFSFVSFFLIHVILFSSPCLLCI